VCVAYMDCIHLALNREKLPALVKTNEPFVSKESVEFLGYFTAKRLQHYIR
jgi:hypothetical protein